MKKLGFIVTLLLICTFVGFSTNSTTSSAKVSISKARKQCSSYKKARKHMKKITFKVWDLKGSKKVTRTKSIYIHKSIASKNHLIKSTMEKKNSQSMMSEDSTGAVPISHYILLVLQLILMPMKIIWLIMGKY